MTYDPAKGNVRGLGLSYIKRYQPLVIKTGWYWCGDIDKPKENNGEPRHINMDIC